jgi:hypothetical protein
MKEGVLDCLLLCKAKTVISLLFKHEVEMSVFESRYILSDLKNVSLAHAYVMQHPVCMHSSQIRAS